MKPNKVAALAALGMLLTSVSVYSLTPPGGLHATGDNPKPISTLGSGTEKAPDPSGDATQLAHFSAGGTLMIEGRLGHPRLARAANGETFMMLEVRGAPGLKGKAAAPVNLSLVIDRSGSMKGTRIRNALSAATAAVDRLNDGDVVSVVTFDTQVQVVVPPTTVGASARERIATSIRGITLGGDTCISCGIQQGMQLLDQTPGKVNRMIVLSDGDANNGIRDVPGFRAMAQRAMTRGIPMTTIGVDVDYNEKILAAIAQESNGRHYFVANDSDLSRVFQAEAEGLTSTVASGAEVAIDLAPGVELDRVFDRSFRRSGNRIIVPLGTFAQDDVKTVLVKLRVPSQSEGTVAIAGVDLNYRDLVGSTDAHCGGKLALEVTNSAGAGDLDPVVNGRVQRSETAATLKDANTLFEQGKFAEAKSKLEQQEKTLRSAAVAAASAAPAGKAKEVADDFQNQIAAIGTANSGFAQAPAAEPASPAFASPPPGVAPVAAAPPAPPQATRGGKSAVKTNAERAVNLGF